MSELKFLHLTTKGMAFDPQTGDSFQLNETARTIMELFQDHVSREDMVQKLVQVYAIAKEQALTDVLEFEIQLKLLGLLK